MLAIKTYANVNFDAWLNISDSWLSKYILKVISRKKY